MRAILVILLTFAAVSAHGEAGQVVRCIQGPRGVASIVVSPASPRHDEPFSISVSTGDHHSYPTVFGFGSVFASVSGQAIDVTMDGIYVRGPPPPRLEGTCGVVTFNGVPPGIYTVNFLVNARPIPLFVAASTTMAVSEASLSTVPASSTLSLGVMVLAVLCLALFRLRGRASAPQSLPGTAHGPR